MGELDGRQPAGPPGNKPCCQQAVGRTGGPVDSRDLSEHLERGGLVENGQGGAELARLRRQLFHPREYGCRQ